ncbi:hypothetical protein ACF0H5_004664 [Mactra antiquata]
MSQEDIERMELNISRISCVSLDGNKNVKSDDKQIEVCDEYSDDDNDSPEITMADCSKDEGELDIKKFMMVTENELDFSLDTQSTISDSNINMNSSALSLDVSQSELACLDDVKMVKIDNLEGSEENSLCADDDISNNAKSAESRLHCTLCWEMYKEPKVLMCLHTFCCECLQKMLNNKNHKFLICPLCQLKTGIPKGGISKLVDNIIISRLIKEADNLCVICKLHNDECVSWGKCIDCGDDMCKNCCEKHTFTRQTVNHTVVSFEEINSKPSLSVPLEGNVTFCKKHCNTKAVTFCKDCCVSLCKECVNSQHSRHSTKDLNIVEREKRSTLQKCLKSVEESCKRHLNDNSEEALEIIEKKEKEVMREFNNSKELILSMMERKFDKCYNELFNLFKIKKRKYVTHRSTSIKRSKEHHEHFTGFVNFLITNGKIDEIAAMEDVVKARGRDFEDHVSKLIPKISHNHKSWPTSCIQKEVVEMLKKSDIISCGYSIANDTKQSVQKKEMFADNGDIRNSMKLHNQSDSPRSDKQLDSLLSMPYDVSKCLQQRKVNVTGSGSLLGEYPSHIDQCNIRKPIQSSQCHMVKNQFSPPMSKNVGHSHGHQFQSQYRTDFSLVNNAMQSPNYSNGHQGEDMNKLCPNDLRIVNITSKISQLSIKFHGNIMVNTPVDKKIPDVVDLCFFNLNSIAVVDARNLRIKAFDTMGKFVDYIDDPGPMSVTCCANYLIWCSQYSSLKLYDISCESIVRIQKLDGTSSHPLTSFNNMKYLVRCKDKIEASSIDGKSSHVIIPHDNSGKKITDICYIATRSLDQLVLIEHASCRVVVNNFDGKCIGEFYRQGFEPSSACITENNSIFVTDRRNNSIIALSPYGKFVKEWKTTIESPSCIASNGNGLLAVGGTGHSISLYSYSQTS